MLGRLEPSHRIRVADLLARTPEFTPEEVRVALELVDEALEGSDDYRFVVAEIADRVEGYACFGPIPMTKGSYDLYWIVVDRNMRRSGVGRALMTEVKRQVAGAGGRMIRLETANLPSYTPTLAFYERCGFERAGTIRGFYWPGNDLVTFVKYLGERG